MTITHASSDPAIGPADVARVVIPTTNGPVDVVYLARDPALDTSIVCINGTASQAGMSAAYGAFVRRGTGVIERYIGPGQFRLDLSERIDVGDSWKLGVYLAHALQAADRLSLPLDAEADIAPPSVLVWATGAVRSVDLAVGEVANVAEKLRFSLPLFEAARGHGLRCLAIVPRGNADDGDPGTMARMRALGVEFMAVRQIDEAVRVLGLAPPARAASAEPSEGPQWKGNPFRGLEPFTPEHRRIFFGRARAREEVVERLITAAEMGRAFVLIHGRSGSGKSSLALAGIAGDVAARPLADGVWQMATMRPGDAPLAALSGALAPWSSGDGDPADLTAAPREWAGRLVRGMAAQRPAVSVVLVIDQLEELHSAPPEQIVQFGDAVEALAESGRVWIVATIRTDRMTLLDAAPALARLASSDRTFRLDRPTPFELLEMVTQPAAMAGLRFETPASGASLPDRLANLAMQSPDSLPLLQAVLTRLAERASGGVLTEEAYDRIGHFEGAISRWADESLVPLRRAGIAEADIDRALAELVRFAPDTGTALAREASLAEGDARQPVLEALVTARVASVGTLPDGTRSVRVSHEALIGNWRRLRDLSERLRVSLMTRDWLERATATWLAGGRVDGDLIGNPQRIADGRRLIREGLVAVPADGEALVARSEARQEEEQQRTIRLAEAEAENARAEAAREAAARRLAENTARTQRMLLMAAGIATIILIAGAAGLVWLSISLNRALDTAQTETGKANAATAIANAERRRAEEQRLLAEAATADADRERQRAEAAADSAKAAAAQAEAETARAKEATERAEAQRDQALTEESKRLALLSERARTENDHVAALEFALAGLPDADMERPLVVESTQALGKALRAYHATWRLTGEQWETSSWLTADMLADGSVLLTRNEDDLIYRLKDGSVSRTDFAVPTGEEGWKTTALSPDQRFLVACGGSVQVVDLRSGTERAVDGVPAEACHYSVQIAPDSRQVVLADEGSVFLVDLETAALLPLPVMERPEVIVATGFVDGNLALAGYDGGKPELRLIVPGRKAMVFGDFAIPPPDGDPYWGDLTALGDTPDDAGNFGLAMFSPDGRRLLLSRPGPETVAFVDTTSGATVQSYNYVVSYAVFSPDGRRVLAHLRGDAIMVFSVEETYQSYLGDDDGMYGPALSFAGDSTRLAVGGISTGVATGNVWSYDLTTLGNYGEGDGGPQFLKFAPDGRHVLSGYGSELIIWDTSSTAARAELADPAIVRNAAYAAQQGDRVALESAEGIEVWDAGDNIRLLLIFPPDSSQTLVLPRTGRYLVTAGYGDTVRVYDVDSHSQQPILTVPIQWTYPPVIELSADERTLTIVEVPSGVATHYDLATGKSVAVANALAPGQPSPTGGTILRAAALKGGRTVVLTTDGTLDLIAADGTRQQRLAAGLFALAEGTIDTTRWDAFGLSLSRDGLRLLLTMPNSAQLFDMTNGSLLREIGDGDAKCALASEGHLVLCGDYEGALFDADTGTVLDRFEGGYPVLLADDSGVVSVDETGRAWVWAFPDIAGAAESARNLVRLAKSATPPSLVSTP